MMAMPGPPGMMNMMEHPDTTTAAPPLVDERLVLNFCQAAQTFAATAGCQDEVAAKLRDLRARLSNLQGVASLCRLAMVGHRHSFARVIDEMHCIAVDFSQRPLPDEHSAERTITDSRPDASVSLAAAIDLFAGASFVSKDRPEERNRFIVGVVRAIEDAIAFPVTFAAEAAAYIGAGDEGLSPQHTALVIANAVQRLLDGDQKCVPLAPADIRFRLESLARAWMHDNPVDAFLAAVSGPRVRHIIHWEDPSSSCPDAAHVGDPVVLFVDDHQASAGRMTADDIVVMFSPHQPAKVIRAYDDRIQVEVPKFTQTGPVAVLPKKPNFSHAQMLVGEYSKDLPVTWLASVFGAIRIDTWAYPTAFWPPVLKISAPPAQDQQGPVP
jgi:hypothetical protein